MRTGADETRALRRLLAVLSLTAVVELGVGMGTGMGTGVGVGVEVGGEVESGLGLELGSEALGEPSEPVLQNERVRLEFASLSGPRALSPRSLQVLDEDGERYTFPFRLQAIWALTLRRPGPEGATIRVVPTEADATRAATRANPRTGAQALTVVWELAARPLTVTVTVALRPGDPFAEWTIAVENGDEEWALYAVDFPRLRVEPVGRPGTNRAALPYLGGRLVYNPVQGVLRNAPDDFSLFPYPHLQTALQLFGYYDEEDGFALYLAAHDGAGYTKAFDFRSDGETFRFAVRHFPEDHLVPGNDYRAPYPVAVGAVPGDWYDLARVYRAWALEQPWAARGPIALDVNTNTDGLGFSPKLRDVRVMGVWNPFGGAERPFEAVADDMERWRRFLDVERVAGLWYGWHGNEFDTGWPDYEPVRPSFPDGVERARAAGNLVWPYILPTVWDTANPSYTASGAARFALKDEDGRVQTSRSAKGALFARMDPATPFWQAFVRDWVVTLQRDFGVDGVYLDTWSGVTYGFCYDPDHGHPLGGGNYLAEGTRRQGLLIREAARAADPGFVMMSEHPGELYLDLLEIENVEYVGPLNPGWWTLPLFSAVYHDYIRTSTFVNTSAALEDAPGIAEALRFAWATRYVQGNLLAVNGDGAGVLRDPPETTPNFSAYRFLKELVGSYAYARPYVLDGERLRDPTLQVERRPLQAIGGGLFGIVPYGPSQPAVLASAWRSWEDGSVGLVLVNWTDDPQLFTLDFDPARYGLAGAEELVLYDLGPQGEQPVERFSGARPLRRLEFLPARSVKGLKVQVAPPEPAEPTP